MGDALTKGTGTPWGPMESGRPQTPNYETDFATDPTQFKGGFDYSPLASQLKNDIALQGGNAQRNYLAGTSKLLGSGTTSGSGAGQLANIAAQTEKNQNAANLDIGRMGWEDQLRAMDAFNAAKNARNRLKQGQYGTDLGAYGQEEQGRGEAIGGLLGGLGRLGGGYLGRQQ